MTFPPLYGEGGSEQGEETGGEAANSAFPTLRRLAPARPSP